MTYHTHIKIPSFDLILDIIQTNMNKVLIKVFIISCFLPILVNCTRPPECELPKEVGPCRAAIPSFYFNSSSNKCESFMYGGCKGKSK